MTGSPEVAEATVVCTVGERREVAEGIVSLTLRSAGDDELPAWQPGAHVDLVLPEHVRQYSLCGDVDDRAAFRIAVLRELEGRGGSAHVHDHLHEGAQVELRGPRSHFALEPAASYVFIAGGIGITPILPMLAAARAAGARWELHYGGRRRTSMAFLDELTAYGDGVRTYPEDEVGLIDLDAALAAAGEDGLVYACGPEVLLEAVEGRCGPALLPRLRTERFSAAGDTDRADDQTFEVVLSRSGMTLTVEPGESILEVCEDAGVEVLCSCEEGVCGTCETPVVEGAIDHRDTVLDDQQREAGDTMMICVSRSKGPRLVLDL